MDKYLVIIALCAAQLAALRCDAAPLPSEGKKQARHWITSSFDTKNNMVESRLFKRNGPRKENGKTVWDYVLVVKDSKLKLVNGPEYKVWAYGGTVPGPTLVAREGDWVRIKLVNETSTPHTIHSHGLYTPNRMDGVPHTLSSGNAPRAVEPGESFTYEYIARPSGTHFYHCHVKTNEHMARGLSGALIVLPKEEDIAVDQDRVFILQEWNSKYAKKGRPGDPREMYDADYFTINGRSFPETENIYAKVGEILRLRFINAGNQEHFIHLHGHRFLVTHKDGAKLENPEEMDTVPIGPAERKDILLVANNPGEWPFHCHSTPHVTNAGVYPGGMLMHLVVGDERFPQQGEGPVGYGNEKIRELLKRIAKPTVARQLE